MNDSNIGGRRSFERWAIYSVLLSVERELCEEKSVVSLVKWYMVRDEVTFGETWFVSILKNI